MLLEYQGVFSEEVRRILGYSARFVSEKLKISTSSLRNHETGCDVKLSNFNKIYLFYKSEWKKKFDEELSIIKFYPPEDWDEKQIRQAINNYKKKRLEILRSINKQGN